MLEREEGEILHAAVRAEIVQKPFKPGSIPLRIRPDLDIFIDALKSRAAEFDRRIDFVDGSSELKI